MSDYSLTIRDESSLQTCDIVYTGNAAFVTKIMVDVAGRDALGSHLQNSNSCTIILSVPRPEDEQKKRLATIGPVKSCKAIREGCNKPGDIAQSSFFTQLDCNMLWGELTPRLDYSDMMSCIAASSWNARWMDQKQLMRTVRQELVSYIAPRAHYLSETLDEILFLSGFSFVPEWARTLSGHHVERLRENLLVQKNWKTSLLRINLTALWPCKPQFKRYFENFAVEFLLTFGETADTVHEALGPVYSQTHLEPTRREVSILHMLKDFYGAPEEENKMYIAGPPTSRLAVKELKRDLPGSSDLIKWVIATQITADDLRNDLHAILN